MRKQVINKVYEKIDKADLLGIRRVEITSGKEARTPEREKRIEKLISSLGEICKYADDKERKAEILLETFDYNVEKERMRGPSQKAAKVAGKISQDFTNFGILLDPTARRAEFHGLARGYLRHIPLLKEEIEASMKLVGNHFRHVHLGRGGKEIPCGLF